jgi:hypothetical protein
MQHNAQIAETDRGTFLFCFVSGEVGDVFFAFTALFSTHAALG